MTTEKKSAIIYSDWIEQFESLSDEEAGKLIKHLMRYINDLNPKAPDRMTELLFIPIQQCINRDKAKWNERAERSRTNGHKGGRPQIKEDITQDNLENPVGYFETQETQEVILEPTKPDNGNVNVNVNGNVNGNGNGNVNDKEEYINTCIETLYSIYPTRCTLRNTATGKCKKNKIQIEKLLAKNTFEELQEIFNLYLDDCKQGKKYLKDFTTFLNNLPDVNSLKKPIVTEQASASNQNMPMSHEAKHIHKKLPDPMMLTEATYYSECLERFIEPLDYHTLKPLDLSLDVITIPVDYSKTILKK